MAHQLRLLKLDARLQAWLKTGALSEGHGKILAGVPIEQQYHLAYHTIQKEWSTHALMKAVQAIKFSSSTNLPKPASPLNSETAYIERRLGDKLGYPVKLTLIKNQSGYLRINFVDLEHLQCILEKLSYSRE